MKKFFTLAFIYSILALIAGVFFREFTKAYGFTGDTTLGFLHVHLFTLGMFFFLIVGILDHLFKIQGGFKYKVFIVSYNIGLIITVIMLLIRSILQVMETNLSKGLDASISGIAGIGHIILGVGIIFFFIDLLSKTNIKEK